MLHFSSVGKLRWSGTSGCQKKRIIYSASSLTTVCSSWVSSLTTWKVVALSVVYYLGLCYYNIIISQQYYTLLYILFLYFYLCNIYSLCYYSIPYLCCILCSYTVFVNICSLCNQHVPLYLFILSCVLLVSCTTQSVQLSISQGNVLIHFYTQLSLYLHKWKVYDNDNSSFIIFFLCIFIYHLLFFYIDLWLSSCCNM